MLRPDRKREFVDGEAIHSVEGLSPTAEVHSISGVRVFDVGQGDALAVLDQAGNPFLQIDYGGCYNSPFSISSGVSPDHTMPLGKDSLLMLTHWDKDHWWSADMGTTAKEATWLVPRQLTSPTAACFSASLSRIFCIPEDLVGLPQRFVARNGDAVIWEKIARSAKSDTSSEDCNRTGVAYSLVKQDTREVILLPGDAPFDRVAHYQELASAGMLLRGVVAYHHGSRTHWTAATDKMLSTWRTKPESPVVVALSYGRRNSYGHPKPQNYRAVFSALNFRRTPAARAAKKGYFDITF
jgi:hypothetical protein